MCAKHDVTLKHFHFPLTGENNTSYANILTTKTGNLRLTMKKPLLTKHPFIYCGIFFHPTCLNLSPLKSVKTENLDNKRTVNEKLCRNLGAIKAIRHLRGPHLNHITLKIAQTP